MRDPVPKRGPGKQGRHILKKSPTKSFRRPLNSPRWPQDGSKMALRRRPDGPKMAQRCPWGDQVLSPSHHNMRVVCGGLGVNMRLLSISRILRCDWGKLGLKSIILDHQRNSQKADVCDSPDTRAIARGGVGYTIKSNTFKVTE